MGLGCQGTWGLWVWVGCRVLGLWGHRDVVLCCPETCPEACTGLGAMGPGCPLCRGQQVPTLPSPGSADVSGPTPALPSHVVTATL